MIIYWTGILSILLAYFLGAIPFGYIVVRWNKGVDIRAVGSGNVGATNALRAAGWSGALLTLMLDAAKGYLAVLGASYLTNQNKSYMALAAVAAVLGHVFPVYLKFKGGKGVATGVGIFLYLATIPLLGAVAIFVAVLALSRFVSLGSIIGACSFPILYFLLSYRKDPSLWILLAAVSCSSLVVWRHRDNIKRLVAGTESRFTGLKK
jgi:acyl phosphate:glycerol-3-phosphate acyltransferase